MTAADRHVIIDAGPFGPWGSGHSHSDTLSVIVRLGHRDILVDAGTFTYVGDESRRNWFRGSAAHNTIRIDGFDQAIPEGPFRWTDQPQVRINDWQSSAAEDYLDAECAYRGFTHRRQVRFTKPDLIVISDEISGPPGEHDIEQFWHPGSPDVERCFVFDGTAEPLEGWKSDVFGEEHGSPMLRIHRRSELPLRLETKIHLE
jgi:hypothetical protein